MDINEIKRRIAEMKTANERENTVYELAVERISDMRKNQEAAQKQIAICRESTELLERFANSRRTTLKEKIEEIITEALQAIYGETYRIEMSYQIKNNRSHLSFEVVKKTSIGEVRRQIGGFGLGVADMIAIPLRLLILSGAKGTDKVCFLDESNKHAYEGDVKEIASFISSISKMLGIQLFLCTHHPEVCSVADTVFEVSIHDGTSSVRRLKG